MAELERTEGDYTYWSDGAQRYAKDNSLGKAPGSLAKRYPGSRSKSFNELPVSRLRELQSMGGKASYEKRKAKVAEAYAYVLGNTHPDSKTEEQGLAMLAEAAFVQGSDPDGGGAAVKAREQFVQEYTGGKQQEKHTIDARQIHITISPGVELEQRQLVRALEVVDVEARVVEDDDE